MYWIAILNCRMGWSSDVPKSLLVHEPPGRTEPCSRQGSRYICHWSPSSSSSGLVSNVTQPTLKQRPVNHSPCLAPDQPSPLPRSPENQPSNHTRCDSQPAHDRRAHQALLVDLVVNQPFEAACLQVRRLEPQQQLVVPARVGVVAQLVVAQRQVVEALAPPLRRVAVDLRQQPHAFLCVLPVEGFDQALSRTPRRTR